MQNERLAACGLGCKVVFVSSVSSHRSFMRRTRTLLALRSARYLRGHALVLQKPGGHCCPAPRCQVPPPSTNVQVNVKGGLTSR